jgi:hypothetical protein
MLIAHLKQTFLFRTHPRCGNCRSSATKICFPQEEGFKKIAHDEVVARQADEINIRLGSAP